MGDGFGKGRGGGRPPKKTGTLLYDKGKYIFFLMLLFPVFPDDVLCLIAGMTTMSYKFFLMTIILTRPIGIAMTCYLGGGDIIPYTEHWGIACWAVIIVFIVLAFWLAYKYKTQIEDWVNRFATKMRVGSQKFGQKIKTAFQDFGALFSKKYKAKLLLQRNKLPYLLLTEGLPENEGVSGRIRVKRKTKTE